MNTTKNALKILAPCGTRQKYLQNDKKHISDKVTLQSATKASFPSSSGVAGRLDTKPVDHTSYGNKNENHICLIFPHPDHCHITNIVIFIITTRSPNWNCDRGFHLYTCWSQTPTTHQRKLLHRRFHQFSAITWFYFFFVRKCSRVLCHEIKFDWKNQTLNKSALWSSPSSHLGIKTISF